MKTPKKDSVLRQPPLLTVRFVPLLFLALLSAARFWEKLALKEWILLWAGALLLAVLFLCGGWFASKFLKIGAGAWIQRGARLVLLFIAVQALAVSVLYGEQPERLERLASYQYLVAECRGQVTKIEKSGESRYYGRLQTELVRVYSIGMVPVKGTLLFFSKKPLPLRARVSIRGELEPLRLSGSPGWEAYLHSRNVLSLIREPDRVRLHRQPPFLWRIRGKLLATLEGILQMWPPRSAAFLRAVLLGQRKELGPETRAAFVRAGVVHLLAVSGFHVGILVLLFSGLSKILRLPRGLSHLLLVMLLGIYAFLCGLQPAVLRASLMLVLAMAALRIRGSRSPWHILSLAGIIILIVNPLQSRSPGFLLSFGATGGIFAFYQPFFRRLATWLPSWLAAPLGLSASAQLAVLPLIALFFEEIPLLGLFSNLLVMPWVILLVYAGLAGSLLLLLGVSFVGPLYTACLEALFMVTEWIARLPWAAVPSGDAASHIIPAYCLAGCFFALLTRFLKKRQQQRTGFLLADIAASGIKQAERGGKSADTG